MKNPLSVYFNVAVDPTGSPNYYRQVRQATSFGDIRVWLVKGMYDDNIYDFYNDVCIGKCWC